MLNKVTAPSVMGVASLKKKKKKHYYLPEQLLLRRNCMWIVFIRRKNIHHMEKKLIKHLCLGDLQRMTLSKGNKRPFRVKLAAHAPTAAH